MYQWECPRMYQWECKVDVWILWFQDLWNISIGQNEVDENGEVNHEGKGFSIYFMVYYKGAIHEYLFNLFCQL